MEQSEFEKKLESEIYNLRMLVFLESREPEGFMQFVFTPEHFRKVSQAVAKGFPLTKTEGTLEQRDIEFHDTIIPLEHFEGMQDYYDKD